MSCSWLCITKSKHGERYASLNIYMFKMCRFLYPWLPTIIQILPVVLRDAQQWQQQQTVLRQLCGSRKLTFQCHYFNKNQCQRRALWEGKRQTCMCREGEKPKERECFCLYVQCTVYLSMYKICCMSLVCFFVP